MKLGTVIVTCIWQRGEDPEVEGCVEEVKALSTPWY
jgi:hypothetical protein